MRYYKEQYTTRQISERVTPDCVHVEAAIQIHLAGFKSRELSYRRLRQVFDQTLGEYPAIATYILHQLTSLQYSFNARNISVNRVQFEFDLDGIFVRVQCDKLKEKLQIFLLSGKTHSVTKQEWQENTQLRNLQN